MREKCNAIAQPAFAEAGEPEYQTVQIAATQRSSSMRRSSDSALPIASRRRRDPWSVRLVPYYFFAVALGAHAGCGLATIARGHRIAVRDGTLVATTAALAAAVALLILIGLFRA